jgi:amino acid adenylation domain-containing protein
MNESLAHHYLDDKLELFSGKIAVTDGRTAITYGELADSTDRLAKLLIKLGIHRGDLVAYYLKRSSECITATMGILKAGGAYIPIDQKIPAERWHRIISDAAPKVIICDQHTLSNAVERSGAQKYTPLIICLNPRDDRYKTSESVFFIEDIEKVTGIRLPDDGTPDDVAYVLYTSGSTGLPKGVMITHGNIRNYIDWATSYFRINDKDRILGTAPFYFDMSTFDIFSVFASGATLYLATEELLLFPERLVRFMEDNRVTLWKGVSSLLMYMSRAGVVRPERMPTLRTVIFAGESLAPQYLADWMKNLPNVSYFNGFGPTEATGVSLCYHVRQIPNPDQPIPIGKPCKGAKVAVVGEDSLPVEPGQIGELCISGACLARGYLNDPERTQKRFTPAPPGSGLEGRVYWTGDLVRQTPEGDYVFISRKDYQVKWMGYRIELAEIELGISSFPQVKDVVVLLIDSATQGLSELVAFVEADNDIDLTELNRELKKKLPTYMIPKRFILLESLPRNDRGKVDREEILKQYSRKGSISGDEIH